MNDSRNQRVPASRTNAGDIVNEQAPLTIAVIDTPDHVKTDTDEVSKGLLERKPAFDTVGAIIAYESDNLDSEETIELFQHLIDSGLAWRLQGHYGRVAAALIANGYCHERQS